MIDVVYGGILGLLAGLAFHRITLFQIKKRTDENSKVEAVDNTAVIIIWMLLSAVLFGVIFYLQKETATRLEYVMYVSLAISIGVVDADIRKIPNMSVLALMIVKVAAIIYGFVKGGDFKTVLLPALIGLVVGFVLYQLPSVLHIPIGAGDVKYSTAIGFCLGIWGFLQAELIMAAALVIYLIYLVASKKGSVKTRTPMGPYLSLGVLIAVIWPVLSNMAAGF